MSQLDSTLVLLRQLGWEETLLAAVERHSVGPDFGLEIESPLVPQSMDELSRGSLHARAIFATELIVGAGVHGSPDPCGLGLR